MTLNPINFAVDCTKNAWESLSPWSLFEDPVLGTIGEYLNEATTQVELAKLELRQEYPMRVRQRLHQLGASQFFVDPTLAPSSNEREDSSLLATLFHQAALALLCTAASASLGITVGVNVLGLLPIYFSGCKEQLAWVLARIREGAYASLLLTELAHGSNLLANDTYAEPGVLDINGRFTLIQPNLASPKGYNPTHYRVNGQKDLINGGGQHELLITFVRTKQRDHNAATESRARSNPLASRNDFSLCVFDRHSQSGNDISSPHRWHTLPVPSADISSVRFCDAVIPLGQRLGHEGHGFALVQKTLSFTRGAISIFAAGLAARAVQLATRYAQTRAIYGQPIVALGAIADHLLHMQALELLISALSLKTIAMLNTYGASAGYYSAVAKYSCCTLAEELVAEGRYVHGGRAMLLDYPYQRLIGDVLLFGAFDGTSHLMLDQIQWRLTQMTLTPTRTGEEELAQVRLAYSATPQPLSMLARQRDAPIMIHPSTWLSELNRHVTDISVTPLLAMSHLLLALVRHCRATGQWEQDQGLRFDLGRALAGLETLMALVELADSGARAALGMTRPLNKLAIPIALVRYAYGWFGARLCGDLRQLAYTAVWRETLMDLDHAQMTLAQMMRTGQNAIRENPIERGR